MARQNNIKVVLSGEGADELFAGYVGYRFDEKRSKMRPKADRESLIRQRLWGDSTFVYEKQYAEFEEVKLGLYSQNLREQFEDFSCTNEAILDLEKVENCHVVHRRSYIDFKLRLVEHLISDHGDRMLMANSVEGRFPFLDKDLMEFCTQIPVDLKIRSGIEKYLLKQLGNRVLPREIVHREKFSFVAPGSDTLIKRHKEWANDLLSYNRIKRQGYFDADAIERIKKQYQQEDFKLNLPFDNDLLITVLTFNIFLDQFGLNSYH
jgi:asparagine synthase (glutamine-hydrolysing)